MNMNFKIILIALIIAIIGVGGYFAYTTSPTSQFDTNLKEAYGLNEDANNKTMNMSGASNPYDYPYTPNNYDEATKYYDNTKDITKLLRKEITYLENAKNSANSSEEKEYIDLLIKEEKLDLKWQELELKRYQLNKDFFIATLEHTKFIEERDNVIKEQKSLNVTKAIDDINYFLNKNPTFKGKLKELKVSRKYLGEL